MTYSAPKPETTDAAVLSVLLYEFPTSDKVEVERTIRRRLRSQGFDQCEQERVQRLREFKDQVQEEFLRQERSRYCLGPHGEWASLADFDLDRMLIDFSAAYSDIGRGEIAWFLGFAAYVYYQR